MPDWFEPATLDGRFVRLEPLSLDHADGLAAVGLDASVWRWTIARPETPADIRTWIEQALAGAAARQEIPFATVERASGRPIGSSRFLSIVPDHLRLEIGWTWVAPGWQGGPANSEAKLLMLEHAFERLGARRVEFKTHAANERSRAALLGIGAAFEGVFRKHIVMPGGGVRDSAYYAVIDDDWPIVRAHLEARIERLSREAPRAADRG